MFDPTRFAVLAFDCYGTLIDWESGIARALAELCRAHGVTPPEDQALLAMYAKLEPAAQAGEYRPYRDVLDEVSRGFAQKLGFTLDPAREHDLAESVARWPVFSDTPKALARLAEHYDLAILSNIDRDLFETTRPKLIGEYDFDFSAVITAQDTRSYKPAIGHFWHAIETLGVPGARILHVAQSLFHDVAPAQSMGITTVWVNRRGEAQGSGATPDVGPEIEPDVEVPDMRTLAEILGA